MPKKKDLSDALREKVAARSEAMEATKARIEGTGETDKRGPGRPIDDPHDPRKAVTINLKSSSHKKLKVYAAMHDTTASALVESWIAEHCSDKQ